MLRLRNLATLAACVVAVSAQAPVYGQCGGIGWSGATTCTSGNVCYISSAYYYQCVPAASVPAGGSTVSVPSSTATSTAPVGTATPPKGAKLQFAGVNIAGFDFGCNIDGSCTASAAYPPLTEYYGHDGRGQMQHFVKDDGFNVFRLPVSWQYLTNNSPTGTLNMTNFVIYDAFVQACLGTGATCLIDMHNYARYNGAIIGQGGPSNAAFASLWGNVAAQYANNTRIIFGIMNEPHDVPDITMWAATVQAAVTAIRNAGAKTQLLLLPGNNFTSAQQFVTNGSGPALLKVTNPDGTTTGLVFDVHKYSDTDNSGTHPECTTNNIDNAFSPLATWLRQNKRQAFNTEMGGGNVASCATFVCQQIAFMAANSDVYLGYIGWAAGNFDAPSYVLSEVPVDNNGVWTDQTLVKACIAPSSGSQTGSYPLPTVTAFPGF